MDSAPNNHVAPLTPTNPTDKQTRDISNPNPTAKTQPTTISTPTIAAHFADLARDKSCSTASDRAREVYINRQLVDQFGQKFGMSEAHAKAAVEEEMRRRYKPNPWDAPGPRRLMPKRNLKGKGGSGRGEQSAGEGEEGGLRHSEKEWDLFERVVGYR